jgi:hypothetical protein
VLSQPGRNAYTPLRSTKTNRSSGVNAEPRSFSTAQGAVARHAAAWSIAGADDEPTQAQLEDYRDAVDELIRTATIEPSVMLYKLHQVLYFQAPGTLFDKAMARIGSMGEPMARTNRFARTIACWRRYTWTWRAGSAFTTLVGKNLIKHGPPPHRRRVAVFTKQGSFGIFRDTEDWVRVRYADGRELDVTKARYIASKRAPPFNALPLIETFGPSWTSGSVDLPRRG